MSTHNIGFYEDFTKIIFQLSSIIIIYAHYLFFCMYHAIFLSQDKTVLIAYQNELIFWMDIMVSVIFMV